MDYHLVHSPKANLRTDKSLSLIIQRFLPLFAIALFLPFLLFFAQNSSGLQFTSQANPQQTLRIWFEPSSVSIKRGETITINVMGNYQSVDNDIQNININLPSTSGLAFQRNQIQNTSSFRGTTKLGEISVSALAVGSYNIAVSSDQVVTSIPGLDIQTSPLSVDVKR